MFVISVAWIPQCNETSADSKRSNGILYSHVWSASIANLFCGADWETVSRL
jgi:hypothetical protein